MYLIYSNSEVNSSFMFKSAEEREKLVAAERKFTDDKVRKIIEFKKKVCAGNNKTFVLINQKGRVIVCLCVSYICMVCVYVMYVCMCVCDVCDVCMYVCLV